MSKVTREGSTPSATICVEGWRERRVRMHASVYACVDAAYLIQQPKRRVERARLAARAYKLRECTHVGLRPSVRPQLVPDLEGGIGRTDLSARVD